MHIQIIGLSGSGKSSFFNILTRQAPSGSLRQKNSIALLPVADGRLDELNRVYGSKKQVNTTLEVMDTPALCIDSGDDCFAANRLEELRRADAFCLLIREFDSAIIADPQGMVDGKKDLGDILSEFIVQDMLLMEKRLQAIRKNNTAHGERITIEKAMAFLEGEQALRIGDFTETERAHLKTLQALTLKPILVLLNLSDSKIKAMNDLIATYRKAFNDLSFFAITAKLEEELTEMEAEEAQIFRGELGILEGTPDRIIAACFDLLDLQVFFTAGKSECRSWSIKKGATAYEAAGKIHSDLQKGFIRAVVLPFAEFASAPRVDTFQKQAQQKRKDYRIQDGDIVEIRFST